VETKTTTMNIHALKAAIDTSPFRPFKLHIADGRNVDVPSADHISIDPKGRNALIWADNGAFRMVNIMLVTEIERAPDDDR
jgi:hypothetical protein